MDTSQPYVDSELVDFWGFNIFDFECEIAYDYPNLP